jgi:hypothetical protein
MSHLKTINHLFNENRPYRSRPYPGPKEGALVLADGFLVPLDFTDSFDRLKVSSNADEVVGVVTGPTRAKDWDGEAYSHYLGHSVRVGYKANYKSAREAADALLTALRDAEETERAVRADPATHLNRELSRHDWFCAFSDSYGVTLAGERHWSEVMEIAKSVPVETARALFAKHAPEGATCPW